MQTPKDVWLGASVRLQRPVPISEPYPHVCAAGAQRRDCAACAEAPSTLHNDGYLQLSRAEFIARTGRAPVDGRA